MPASSLGLALIRERLESALGRFLALDPESDRLLRPLRGKWVALRVLPFSGALLFYHTADGVQVHTGSESAPDVCLSGTPLGFALAGANASREAALFGGFVRVEGDMDVAKRFGELMDAMRIDWEGVLAGALGRDAGYHIAAGLLGLSRWGRASMATFGADLTEFLQEESRALPAQPEVDCFLQDIDTLRADCDRLAVRIQALQARSIKQEAS